MPDFLYSSGRVWVAWVLEKQTCHLTCRLRFLESETCHGPTGASIWAKIGSTSGGLVGFLGHGWVLTPLNSILTCWNVKSSWPIDHMDWLFFSNEFFLHFVCLLCFVFLSFLFFFFFFFLGFLTISKHVLHFQFLLFSFLSFSL